MPLTDPVPSSSFDVLERNIQDTDKFVNQETGTFTNRVGKVIKPIPVIESEANAAVISLGWRQIGLFADGFTYTLQNDIAKDSLGDWYRWNGTLPKVVIAGTLPSSDANFVKIDYKSHAELSDRNPADGSAHNTSDILDDSGDTQQEINDFNKVQYRIFDDYLVKGRTAENTSVTIIGDSNTQGIFLGAPLANNQYFLSYLYRTMRSIFNYSNRGITNDSGRMYETNANMFYGAWYETGMPANGGAQSGGVVFEDTGVVEKEMYIPAGQWIEVKTREIGQIGFFYDGSSALHTATSASISLNGAVIGTLATNLTTLAAHSGFVNLSDDTILSDTIRITAVGGTLIVSGFTLYKTSTVGIRAYSFGWSGRTFKDFNTPTKLQAISTMSNFGVSDSQRKLVIIALGTNSIYNEDRAQTPAAYIASMDSLIAGLRALSTNTSFLLTVPPRADPSKISIQIGGGVTYEDYVDAILAYATANNHGVVRYDRSVISKSPALFYGTDGLHYNANGHEIASRELCDTIGVVYDNYTKTIDTAYQTVKTLVYDIDSFPSTGGSPTIKWQDVPINIDRVKAVRIRSTVGTPNVEIPAEALWDLSTSCGMFWQKVANGNTTRFFYPNINGFVRTTGYHVSNPPALVTAGKPAGYKLVIDYI